jgi:hypothetical protein
MEYANYSFLIRMCVSYEDSFWPSALMNRNYYFP